MESGIEKELESRPNLSFQKEDVDNSNLGKEHVNQMQAIQQQKSKRKHRRGKPKPKNVNKPFKITNWKFQVPRFQFNKDSARGIKSISNNRNRGRAKLVRSQSLVPYNTNKFLMEEHMAEVPSALLTPSGRTRDSSFSVDSEDNYFFSLPEDEEEFLTKEFANVYEKARVERLENLTKQQLIEECLQIEDKYSTDRGSQRQRELNVQCISSEFMSKIRVLEEKIRELTKENYNLRCQLMRSAALAAAASASPPSAVAPTSGACEPTPMDSSSEDSESDSSSTSSSSSSSSSGRGNVNISRRRKSCSSYSSTDNNENIENNEVINDQIAEDNFDFLESERSHLLEPQMVDDDWAVPKNAETG